jgi:ABC-type sugar transport system ATPase subunit
MLEMEHLLDKKPRALSGGQRQRMAVGRALIREPRAFLLDEPLSSLDAQLRERVRHELKELFNKVQATVVYVTHDQVEAMTLANRVVVLSEGCVQQAGTPDELYRFPANRFVASFIGSPSMNLFEVRMLDGVLAIGETEFRTGLPFSGPATVGIRPESLRAVKGASAQVSWVENLGAQFLVGIRLGELSLTLLTAERPSTDAVNVTMREADIHVFESATGRNLRLGAAARSADCEFPAR